MCQWMQRARQHGAVAVEGGGSTMGGWQGGRRQAMTTQSNSGSSSSSSSSTITRYCSVSRSTVHDVTECVKS
jgi:hypothetical protein